MVNTKEEKQINMQKIQEKNVLILSMSTLNRVLREYYYQTNPGNQDEHCFRGVSQLEVGTKYFMCKLANEKKFDKIYIIESEEASKPVKPEKVPEVLGYLADCNMQFIKKHGDLWEISSVSFYKERIYQYVQRMEEAHVKIETDSDQYLPGMNQEIERYEANSKHRLKELYGNCSDLFVDIPMNEEDVYQCVYNLCSAIRKTAEKTKVNLYIDMQGARRYETFIINAAIKMLEISGINVHGSVAINFAAENNRNGNFNTIVDTIMNDRIFEMVSGMNEFMRTGRGDTLLKFWDENSKELGTEKKIIEQIGRISHALSLCNMNEFDRSLDSFSKAIQEYQKTQSEKGTGHPLFRTFVEDLAAEYKKYNLLVKNGKTRVEDQICWCIDKKLYQQALTLVEAKIPAALVEDRILYYKDDKELRILLDKLIELAKNDTGIPKYYFENNQLKQGDERFIWVKYIISKRAIMEEGKLKIGKLSRHFRTITDNNSSEYWNGTRQVAAFMKLYHELVDWRIDVNHALGSNTMNMAELDKNLRFLMKSYKQLRTNRVDIDFARKYPLKQGNRT